MALEPDQSETMQQHTIEKSFKSNVLLNSHASKQIYTHSIHAKLFYGLFLGVPAALGVYLVFSGRGLDYPIVNGLPYWAFVIFAAVVVFVLFPRLMNFHINKAFLSSPSAQQTQHYKFNDAGLRNHGKGYNVEMNWSALNDVVKTDAYLLFFVSSSQAYYVPLNLFSNAEVEQVMRWYKEYLCT